MRKLYENFINEVDLKFYETKETKLKHDTIKSKY